MFKVVAKALFFLGNPIYKLIGYVGRGLFAFGNRIRFLRFKWKGVWYLTGTILVLTLSWWTYKEIIRELPDVNKIYNPPVLSSKILDRNGNLLYKFYVNENRTWIPIDRIPKHLIEATIAIEDKDFYRHHGISIKGIVNAVLVNFKNFNSNKPRGGSTITQQLVKNIFFNGEKTWKRKIKEAVLTLMIENKLSKNEILERYFNQVGYGGDTYGVQEASFKYFKKNVEDLNLAESAFLAGLPAAPSSYYPFGNNPELAYLRQKHVIEEMVSAGFINKAESEKVLKEPVILSREYGKIIAPHFVFHIKNILENRFAYENFERLGLTVYTSLDLETQKMAEEIVKEEMEKIKNLRISNGAALITDPKTGDILAMVGSKDYNALDIDGKYNVTTALRQPGSSIKPINYLLALENGLTLNSTIEDAPISYQIRGQKPYTPQNYNGKYMGQVSLRTALASSLNIPSVKLLAENGVDKMIDLAEKMGISSWQDRSRFGLSLALGSGEVKMTELSEAYSVFANSGEKVNLDPIMSIENYLGDKIYHKQTEKNRIVSAGTAFLINSVLSDNNARAPIFGTNSKLKIEGKTVAVKTGTTNNLKDNWCIGWTPSILVTVWVGNNDNTAMSWVASGISGATPIWNRIMNNLLANKNNEEWSVPNEIIKANVCGKEEFFIKGSENKFRCTASRKMNKETELIH